jgi:hypothetical protein
MCDSLKQFKEEMEKRGLFRKITVAANLIPPPPGIDPEAVIALHKLAAKEAVIMYAQKHDDFCELMAEAATDHLFDTILTDELFKPVEGFTPTDEERAKMEEAEKTAKALSGLFDLLKRF